MHEVVVVAKFERPKEPSPFANGVMFEIEPEGEELLTFKVVSAGIQFEHSLVIDDFRAREKSVNPIFLETKAGYTTYFVLKEADFLLVDTLNIIVGEYDCSFHTSKPATPDIGTTIENDVDDDLQSESHAAFTRAAIVDDISHSEQGQSGRLGD
ncbi:uncharacterized protein N7473_003648 [Penicillium subrubescens]|uniref:uncharacterized protein n=1 Tax=Penicillium subrubescens TaxID=1316194 RepID=UPI0025454DF2|nr:uncharacterized protein N7473_003648 [Penicillium subrubescens]KAJ5906732.1 hypothetical protein N7473_003648 [Penicillium subrubescens]